MGDADHKISVESMVLCLDHMQDPFTGGVLAFYGVLDSVVMAEFPAAMPLAACLLISVFGVRHPIKASLRLVHLAVGGAVPRTVVECAYTLDPCADESTPVVIVHEANGYDLPGRGEYRYQFSVGCLLAEKRMFVRSPAERPDQYGTTAGEARAGTARIVAK